MESIDDVRTSYLFNEQRRLYAGIEEKDTARLAGVFGSTVEVIESCANEVDLLLDDVLVQEHLVTRCARFKDSRLNILVIGDSNTSYRGSYVNILERAFKECTGIRFIDTSIPGLASLGVVDHFHDQVLTHQFDIVLVMIGTNDVRKIANEGAKNNCSLVEYRENVELICSLLQAQSAQILGITIPPINSDRMRLSFAGCEWVCDDSDIQAYNASLTEIVMSHGGVCIDLYGLFEGVNDSSVLPDGLHVHVDMHAKLALLVLDKLAEFCDVKKK